MSANKPQSSSATSTDKSAQDRDATKSCTPGGEILHRPDFKDRIFVVQTGVEQPEQPAADPPGKRSPADPAGSLHPADDDRDQGDDGKHGDGDNRRDVSAQEQEWNT